MTSENQNTVEEYGDHTRIEHTYDESTPASTAIVRAVAAAENVDPVDCPTDLEFTLYDHVDPEALDTLVAGRHGRGPLTVEFDVNRYHVEVDDTGRISIVKYGDGEPPSGSD
ncbi:HalOD1 output domain-containing protein [Natronoglomus mannanivorans]|uniref:Halobacterial output domain-containing protein n=1 Tax=Natronoglomus mannanivorans TaxID=2979990 RepID=A0AAP2Z1X9_9EURY|nr:hypothetical protein [Halobacteria archaeon AArc-xg1-1]